MMRRALLASLLLLVSAGCSDESPTSPGNTTTTTTAPPAQGGTALLRAAQLTEDGRTVDLVANGRAVATSVHYGGVSGYESLAPGDYRLQFFLAGDRTRTLVETVATLRANQTVTVALGGLSSFEVVSIQDDLATRSDRARVKLVNAVPDFPAPFDVVVRNGPLVFESARHLEPTGYRELIPGVYDLELRRSGSSEVVSFATGRTLDAAASYTLFAVGTLRRADIELILVRDR